MLLLAGAGHAAHCLAVRRPALAVEVSVWTRCDVDCSSHLHQHPALKKEPGPTWLGDSPAQLQEPLVVGDLGGRPRVGRDVKPPIRRELGAEQGF